TRPTGASAAVNLSCRPAAPAPIRGPDSGARREAVRKTPPEQRAADAARRPLEGAAEPGARFPDARERRSRAEPGPRDRGSGRADGHAGGLLRPAPAEHARARARMRAPRGGRSSLLSRPPLERLPRPHAARDGALPHEGAARLPG